jgi:flagellar hook-length control protein FliK
LTSANVFNLNSVSQSQTLNANAATGRPKADNPEAASVFASLMNGNYYSANNYLSVSANQTERVSGDKSYEQYQYRDNVIEPAQNTTVTDKINDSSEQLDNFAEEVVQTVADELEVDEDTVTETLEILGMTVLDLLNPQNLATFVTQINGESSPAELLTNGQFLNLMQDMDQMGTQLVNELGLEETQLDELIVQFDELTVQFDEQAAQPEELAPQPDGLTEQLDLLTESQPMEELEIVDTKVNDTTANVFSSSEKDNTVEIKTQQPENESVSEAQPVEVSRTSQPNTEDEFEDERNSNTKEFTSDSVDSHKTGKQTEQPSEISFTVNENEMIMEEPVTQPIEDSYLSVDTMDLIEQIAENVRVNISEGTTSMEMQLNPENLGKVYLQISSKEGVVNANIAASNEQVKLALEAQIADLRQNLSQSGVKVDAIEVTVASHEFEKNLEQNQSGEKQQGERQQEQLSRRRNINMSSLDELSGVMTEEETLVAQIMRDNGNSVDLTA